MNHCLIWISNQDTRMKWAGKVLWEDGFQITGTLTDACTHLILPLPSAPALPSVLPFLCQGKTLLGRCLEHSIKDLNSTGAKILDYYKDVELVCANAALTAEGAVYLLMKYIPVAIPDLSVLVCSWG